MSLGGMMGAIFRNRAEIEQMRAAAELAMAQARISARNRRHAAQDSDIIDAEYEVIEPRLSIAPPKSE